MLWGVVLGVVAWEDGRADGMPRIEAIRMEHDYDEEDVLDLSGDRARELTTRTLLALLEAGEHHLINMGYNPGEVPEFNTREENVWDRMNVIRTVLADRLHITADLEEHEESIENLQERTDGMQYAIDQLKEHAHTGPGQPPVTPI